VTRLERLEQRVAALGAGGLRRVLRPMTPTGPTTAIAADGRERVVFCSNDYLGLAWEPKVRQAFADGGGAGSARLISGDRPVFHRLERALGERLGGAALLFGSGYLANLALYPTLLQAGDTVASDALVHASIIDGLRLSKAQRTILPHGGLDLPADCTALVVESLYSMDGDIADLVACRTATPDAWLCVDEAHAFGTLGPDGNGVGALQGARPDITVLTLGKALGGVGAAIVGPPALRELLISAGRAFIFNTGLPEGVAAAALVGLELATDNRRWRLAHNSAQLRAGLRELGLDPLGAAHIMPVVLGPRAMAIAAALWERGYYAAGIRPPTVAPGTERIRFTLSSEHTEDEIEGLLAALRQVLGG
jgi:8-amino-7-oxononanoate synthase